MFVKPTPGLLPRLSPLRPVLAAAPHTPLARPALARDTVSLRFAGDEDFIGVPHGLPEHLVEEVMGLKPVLEALVTDTTSLNKPMPNGKYPVEQAAQTGQEALLVGLTRMGAAVNIPGRNFLGTTIAANQENNAVHLVRAKANLKDGHGFNALHQAVLHRMQRLVDAILARKKENNAFEVDVFEADDHGANVLHKLAMVYNSSKTPEDQDKLLKIAQTVFLADPERTVRVGDKTIPIVDAPDNSQRTPLILLTRDYDGNPKAIELARFFLDARKANPWIRDDYNHTPLDNILLASHLKRRDNNVENFDAMIKLFTDKMRVYSPAYSAW